MKIAIDIKAFKNGSTGIARYLRSVMDCLQVMDSDNEYFLFECRPSTYLATNPKWKKILVPSKLPGILWQQFILPFQLRKHAIDVLWAGEQICPLFFMSRIKIVTTIFDLAFLHFPETFQLPNLLIQRLLTRHVLKRSDTIITISDFIRRDILTNYSTMHLEKKIKAVPCGKPDWRLPADYARADRKDFLFFAGNNEPRKNLINVLRALALLAQDGFKIALHIAGPAGWKNKKVSDFLAASPVGNQVVFLGFVSEEELRRQYLECKALIYPSVYEGFGLPILEALMLDCPILTSRDTVMAEIAESCADYFNPSDPVDIGAKIKQHYVGNHSANRPAKSPQILARFTWQATALGVLSEFRKLA